MSSEALFGIFPGLKPVHYSSVRRRANILRARVPADPASTGALVLEEGARFGHLTVVRRATPEEQGHRVGSHFVCSCDCGTRHTVKRGNSLRSGCVRTCGFKCRFYRPYVQRAVEAAARLKRDHGINVRQQMAGARFGALTVIGPVTPGEMPARARDGLRCRCDCGAVCLKRKSNIIHAALPACRKTCAARLQLQACKGPESSNAIPRQAQEAAE